MKIDFNMDIDLDMEIKDNLIYIYGKKSLSKVLGVEKYYNEYIKGLKCIKKAWGNNVYTLEIKEFNKRLRRKRQEYIQIQTSLPIMDAIFNKMKGGIKE